jgi:hypothetical protein
VILEKIRSAASRKDRIGYVHCRRERGRRVLCLAHVTNTMGLSGQDFEKGEAQGADEALRVLEALARNLK